MICRKYREKCYSIVHFQLITRVKLSHVLRKKPMLFHHMCVFVKKWHPSLKMKAINRGGFFLSILLKLMWNREIKFKKEFVRNSLVFDPIKMTYCHLNHALICRNWYWWELFHWRKFCFLTKKFTLASFTSNSIREERGTERKKVCAPRATLFLPQ